MPCFGPNSSTPGWSAPVSIIIMLPRALPLSAPINSRPPRTWCQPLLPPARHTHNSAAAPAAADTWAGMRTSVRWAPRVMSTREIIYFLVPVSASASHSTARRSACPASLDLNTWREVQFSPSFHKKHTTVHVVEQLVKLPRLACSNTHVVVTHLPGNNPSGAI